MKKTILNQILALQKKLKPFTQAQINYAHSHYDSVGYLKRGGEIWCQCCGYIHHQLPGIIDIDLELGGDERLIKAYEWCEREAARTPFLTPRERELYVKSLFSAVCWGKQH